MKLIAYKLHDSTQHIEEIIPQEAKQKVTELFERGFDRVLSKWKDNLILLEAITARDSKDVGAVYTQTQLKYHPLEKHVS